MDQDTNSQFCTYTTYENLVGDCLGEEEICNKIFEAAKVDQQWQFQFTVLDQSRIVNKLQPQVMLKLLNQEEILESLLFLCNSIRSNIQKNCLILMREIIIYNQVENIQIQQLIRFLHKIFERCDSDFKFLSSEAQQAMKGLQSIQYESVQNFTNVLESLAQITISQQNKQLWLSIGKAIAAANSAKSPECRKQAQALCQHLMKCNCWDLFIENSKMESENNLEKNLLAIVQIKKKEEQPKNFKDFLKSKQQS